MRKQFLFLVALVAITMTSCFKEDMSVGTIDGYAPVYISKTDAFITTVKAAQKLGIPGKMYLSNNLIYVTDVGTGVHIIDNTIPSAPVKLKFISIPGVHDVAVKGGVLYADNLTDLVAFNVSDINNITFAKRVKNVYPLENQLYPEFATGYFDCADTTKGYIIRWDKATLKNPKCYK